jgi:perosamine synthetase
MIPDRAPIRLVVPEVGDEELREIAEVFASGYLTQGPKVAEFEQAVAARVGVRHAVATTSATTALHLTLAALNIRAGDDVLVPDFTFPATANVVIQQGARPILVDVDLATFTIDPSDMEARIGPRTKAVIPVHSFGLSAQMDSISAVAGAHRLEVVEDAACAIGTTYGGRPVGGLGIAGCFSFHPRKAITTAEGGMVTTDDEALAARLRVLRSHGGLRSGNRFVFEEAGYNYRLSDVQAAMGVVQMRKLDRLIATKRRLAQSMNDRLAHIAELATPVEPPGSGHVYQSYVIRLDDRVDRDGVIQAMAAQGIETTLGTYALHAEPFFRRAYGYRAGDLPNSLRLARQTLTLPLYPGLTDGDLDRITESLEIALAP